MAAIPEVFRNEGDPVTTTRAPDYTDYPDLGRNHGEPCSRPLYTIVAADYEPHYCHLAAQYAAQGITQTGIAVRLGTTVDRLITWMEIYPEFRAVMLRAKDAALAWWEDQLREQAVAGSTAAAKLALTNQFPDHYQDRREHKVALETGSMVIDFTGYNEDDDALDGEFYEIGGDNG